MDLPLIAVFVVIGTAWAVMASLTAAWVWRARNKELTDDEKRSDIDDD